MARPLSLRGYISRLSVTQGEGAGGSLRLFPWEKRFIKGAVAPHGS